MQDYLVFQLYAPLVSWGDQAVGQERPSADHPSRSALLGLIAAALGIDRQDDERQAQLGVVCRFGVKLYESGLALRDFHTVQVPPSSKKAQYLYTRRNELAEPGFRLGTMLSFRTYQQDSFSVAALWLEHSEPACWTLAEIGRALAQPHFQLYLGRKSCPLALPLNPLQIAADSLQQALDQYQPAAEMQRFLHRQAGRRYYWEFSENIGMTGLKRTGFPVMTSH
ncbi:MAG: type I-E CRISPR-associated protein Cas5/CasD [Thiolinea sp.]